MKKNTCGLIGSEGGGIEYLRCNATFDVKFSVTFLGNKREINVQRTGKACPLRPINTRNERTLLSFH